MKIQYVLCHDCLLTNILQGRMKAEPKSGRKRLCIKSDFVENDLMKQSIERLKFELKSDMVSQKLDCKKI